MFLDLPPRSTKPRNLGLTAVIDNGIAFESFVDNTRSTASIVDYVKFGWGTGVITPLLDEKIKVLRDNAVNLPISALFRKPTVAELAAELAHSKKGGMRSSLMNG